MPSPASTPLPGPGPGASTSLELAGAADLSLNLGAIALRDDQRAAVEAMLATLDFEAMDAGQAATFGMRAEQDLGRTLDGLLARVDKQTPARVFDLFARLQRSVDDADLPDLLDQVQRADKPGLSGFLRALFLRLTGRGADAAALERREALAERITARTRALAAQLQALEIELGTQLQALGAELAGLGQLKRRYGEHFGEFTVQVAVARALVDKAAVQVCYRAAAADPGDAQAQAHVRDLEARQRALASRALALEGTYARLPADRLVVEQAEDAGLATLQETATTVASRFASIKMALLSIQGSFAAQTAQQLVQRQARLDEQLAKVRGQALGTLAATTARAPADDRLAQARQIEAIIASTREIDALVQDGRRETEARFDQARAGLERSRRALAPPQPE